MYQLFDNLTKLCFSNLFYIIPIIELLCSGWLLAGACAGPGPLLQGPPPPLLVWGHTPPPGPIPRHAQGRYKVDKPTEYPGVENKICFVISISSHQISMHSLITLQYSPLQASCLPVLKKFILDDEGLEISVKKRGAAPGGGGLVLLR